MKSKVTFKAYRVHENESGFIRSVEDTLIEPIDQGELLVRVCYSSLNYKDALSATGNKGVTRSFPHTPGIDAAGIVEESKDSQFSIGDKVIVTSYDLGMNTDGGFAEYIRVPAHWVLKLPDGLSMKESMAYGTAGLTAGMSVWKLSQSVKKEDGKIVVSGATGGVGALSVSILSKLGYAVIAITGKESERGNLIQLGAEDVILRNEFENNGGKPLLKTTFAGGIDTVGGVILENIIKSTQQLGCVTCCGNVASPKLELTVFPFILRGISLIGIDSQNFPMTQRKEIWQKLSDEWKIPDLSNRVDEIGLNRLDENIDKILKGQLKKRVVIKI
ncbi:YhdH/YhfP family quinone oxidoreductase [Echinicola sp. 20G]|uniref:YhdH/YhfP family quinone oxidoreductase n=1 Tax=Echinicola sp. 20G TaxID=2781961 RepID=UPI00190FD14D|nr:YhdH/YhfP family quinone oxidoreductase [Echinicola sp. 20G]